MDRKGPARMPTPRLSESATFQEEAEDEDEQEEDKEVENTL